MRAGLVALVAGGLLAGGQAEAAPRDTALIQSFRSYCTSERPNFAHIDQQATAAGLQVLRSIDKPLGGRVFIRQKMWLLIQQDGQHALTATEGNGPDGYLSGCGIVSPDINAPGFTPALTDAFKLGRPSSEKAAPVPGAPGTQVRMMRWEGVFGPGTTLQMIQGSVGAGLDYLFKGPRRP